MATSKPKRIFLVDGYALAYRSHFSFIKNPLKNAKGFETSAIFGFANTLFRLIEMEKPDYLGVVFDAPEKTFRHELYKDYKATRDKMPDELKLQLPFIKNVVEAMNIPEFCVPGFEADDVLGTLAKHADEENLQCFLVSGDKDFMQLINDNIKMYVNKKGDIEIWDEQAPVKKWGVTPKQVIDFMALVGDSSDNVPGVPGVGPKTAEKLMHTYKTLDAVYEDLANIKPAGLQKKLTENKDLAYLSKQLVTIDVNVDVSMDLDHLKLGDPDRTKLIELFEEFEFSSLSKKIKLLEKSAEDNSKEPEVETGFKKFDPKKVNYVLVDTPEQLKKLHQDLKNSDSFAFDLETTGLNAHLVDIVGMSFCYKAKEAFYIPFNKDLKSENILKTFKDILEDPSQNKGGQNIKYDCNVLKHHGISVKGIAFDSMLESYLLKSNSRMHGIDFLSQQYLEYEKIKTLDLIGKKGKDQKTMDEVDIELIKDYACEDADICFQLHQILYKRIQENDLNALYTKIELPCLEVLSDMESYGIKIDTSVLDELKEILKKELEGCKKSIFEAAGKEFNLNSPKQMGPILFEDIKIQGDSKKRIKKTKTGYATDHATLEKYADHPVIKYILSYRNHAKLLSTYVDALPELVNPQTQKIHSSFNQTIAATGRLSSSDPNLQNIPIRTELGKKIRRAFVASKPGWKIVSADYSQIELRILAHLAEDPGLMKAFQEDQDVHTQTAAAIFQKDPKDVSSELRSRAKAINFGVLYGMGPSRLARETGVTMDEAKEFIEVYFQKFSSIKNYIDTQVDFARQHGFVETMMGRKRNMDDIYSKNPGIVANAERIAVNTPIQGSAADLIKIAMINVHKALQHCGFPAHLMLQVHDELLLECPEENVEALTKIVREKMSQAIKLNIPLKVDVNFGNNWAEAH